MPPKHAAEPAATFLFAPTGAQKGRGTVWAIEHRFSGEQRDEFDDGWGTLEQAAREEGSEEHTSELQSH